MLKLSMNSINSYVRLESEMSRKDDTVLQFDAIDEPTQRDDSEKVKHKVKKCCKTYRCCCISLSSLILSLTFFLVFCVFIVIPFSFYFFPEYTQFVFFLNFRRIPMVNYDDLYASGVKSFGRVYHIDGEMGKIGVWHVLPNSTSSDLRLHHKIPTDQEMIEMLRKDDKKVILYCHGNSFDRTYSHRILLYNRLSEMDYHVMTFDYRGYGDSDGSPTEKGIVTDARTVYDHLKKILNPSKEILIWGHSMGTGVTARLAMELSVENEPPLGIILESPFNNLKDAMLSHPASISLIWMTESMVDNLLIEPLNSVGLLMTSDDRIKNITCPILIIHAQDDIILPVKLGRRLFNSALKANRTVDYIEVSKSLNFGHKFICNLEALPQIMTAFESKLVDETFKMDTVIPTSKDYKLYTKPVPE